MSCGSVDEHCCACALSAGRTRVVRGKGPCGSAIVFIGEAPGADEDLRGEPFVGMAGRMLTEAITDAGARREDVYITNVVKCRPPDNRKPRKEEVEACAPNLISELEEIRPKVVVALGLTVANGLFGIEGRMADIAGGWTDAEMHGLRFKVIVTYHPAGVLYDRGAVPRFKGDVRAGLEKAGLV
jgi:DNA polymerase